MLWGQKRYVLRRERSGGVLFDRQTGMLERIGEGNYILLERATNLGTGASGVRKFVADSFADERTAEAFLGDCVRRGILEEEKGSELQIIKPTLPPERLPLECNSAPNRLFWRISGTGKDGKKADIPLDQAKTILKKIADAGTFEVWIFGDEPIAHPYFPGIINAAKENGLYITLETTAAYDEGMRNLLFDSLIDRFAVVIAGGASIHNTLFGDGSYQKMVEFISRLAQRGEKRIKLVVPLGKSNIDKLEDAVGMAKAVRSQSMMVMPAAGKESISFDSFTSRVKTAATLASGLGVKIITPCDLLKEPKWQISGCSAGVSDAFLNYDNTLRACRWCDANSEPLGDIVASGYLTLWLDSGRFAPYRTEPPACIARKKLFV
jgi:pyruvate-formate lyase-activating enzyme